jgi:hypothetical protein
MEVLRRRSTSESGADENELNFSTLKTELPIRSKLTAAIVTWLKEKDAEYNRGEELPAVAENTNTAVYRGTLLIEFTCSFFAFQLQKIQPCIEEFC